jgi:hypothetical protein
MSLIRSSRLWLIFESAKITEMGLIWGLNRVSELISAVRSELERWTA